MAGSTAQTGIAVLSSLVVARMLAPTDYAVMALAAAVVALVSRVGHVGLTEAIVRESGPIDVLCHTAFWTQAALAAAILLGVSAAAMPLATFYDEPRLRLAVPVLALGLAGTMLAGVPRALLQRELRLRELNLVDVARSVLVAAMAVSLAVAGAGWWALVLPPAAGVLAMVPVLAWRARYRPRPVFAARRLRSHLRFGSGVFGARLLAYLSDDLDYFVLGKYLPAATYGHYYFAYVRARQPYLTVAPALQAPLFAAFSELRADRPRLARAVRRVAVVHFAVLAPLALFLALLADPAIPLVFGGQWAPSVPLVQVFALMVIMSAAGGFGGSVFLALGRSWLMVGLNAVRLGAVGATLVWGVVTGRSALAIAVALALANAAVLAGHLACLFALLRFGRAELWRIYGRTLCCLALAAAGWAVASLAGLRPGAVPAAAYVVVMGSLLAGLYLAGLVRWNRPVAGELLPWLRSRVRRRAGR